MLARILAVLVVLALASCKNTSSAPPPAVVTEWDFAADPTLRLEPGQIGVTFLEAVDAPPDGLPDTRIPGLDIIPFEVTEERTYEYVLDDPRGAIGHAVIATGDAEAVLLDLTPASPAGSVVLKPGWYALLLVSANTIDQDQGETSTTAFLRPPPGWYLAPAELGAALPDARLALANPANVSIVIATGSCPGCNLTSANLVGASLVGANLTGASLQEARLGGANLTRAQLGYAGLSGADLTGTTLAGANLSCVRASPMSSLRGATMGGANLVGADLTDADLSGTSLMSANLSDATIAGADLTRASLVGATLARANLGRANLTGAALGRANLSDANLSGAKLTGATLRNANLTRADLSGAFLAGANLTDAIVTGANLTGAYLTGAIWTDMRTCAEGSIGVCR